MIEVGVGFILGVISSAIVWLAVTHLIVPSIAFFPDITRTVSDETPSGYKYRVRFQNRGHRAILDLELFACLRIQGLAINEPSTWRAIYIPVDDPRIPRVLSHRKSGKRLAVQLLVHSLSDSARACLPAELQTKTKDGTLRLEDIMAVGKNARLQVFAFGYDSFSGARKVFESQVLEATSIVVDTGN